MAKDPAFLFYPGDYLRDTQCLSEQSQVAYDRIMCEHMRNICITQQQLKFFTKRLNEDEREELNMILTKTDEGFQIEWVVESILKRRSYSESRRLNRSKKNKKDVLSYDKHMVNENEIGNSIVIEDTIIKELQNSFSMKEKVGGLYRLTPVIVDIMLNDFIKEQEAKDELDRSLRDLRKHFVSWCRTNKKDYSQVQQKSATNQKVYKPVVDPNIDWNAEYKKFEKKNPDKAKKSSQLIAKSAIGKGGKNK